MQSIILRQHGVTAMNRRFLLSMKKVPKAGIHQEFITAATKG
ncbi:hypothetical protein [Paenibacillus tritici]|nr:hypothetical protein [Paenibacillus tritici]